MKLPPFIELYRALIATPSISATDAGLDQSNEALINLLAGWFADTGFRVDVQPVPESRHKFNLLASIGEGSGGLLLAGHTDTVPYDEGRWTRDPFTLTEHDNKLYGLGTADMKGFFAFILDAVRDIDASKLTKPLYILATADEETTMAGARYFAASTAIRPDFAIIGEPTSLQPVRAHKGHMANAIRIVGQSGHSSDPARGVNAIDLMHESIGRLMELRKTLQERYNNPAFAVPYPTMNFGHISGGDAANRICACCELHGYPPAARHDARQHQRTDASGAGAGKPTLAGPPDHRRAARVGAGLRVPDRPPHGGGDRGAAGHPHAGGQLLHRSAVRATGMPDHGARPRFHRSGPPAGRIHRHRVYRTDAQTAGPAGQSLLPAINPTFNRGNVLCFPYLKISSKRLNKPR